MRLRYHIPIPLFVAGPTLESVDLVCAFSYRGMAVSARLEGEEAQAIDEAIDGLSYYRRVSRLDLLIVEPEDRGKLNALVGEWRDGKLLRALTVIANRCLRAIRAGGAAIRVHELPEPKADDVESELRNFDVELSDSGEVWRPVLPPLAAREVVIRRLAGGPSSSLLAIRWSAIAEAIEEDRPAAPEDEFTTNAVEHLELRN